MEQQQKKHDGPVLCVCEERRASEHQKSAEPEVVHGSVPARCYLSDQIKLTAELTELTALAEETCQTRRSSPAK